MKLTTIQSHLSFIQKGTAVVYTKGGEIPKALSTKTVKRALHQGMSKAEEGQYAIVDAAYVDRLVVVNTEGTLRKLNRYIMSIRFLLNTTDIKKVVLSLSANKLTYDEALCIYDELKGNVNSTATLFVYQ